MDTPSHPRLRYELEFRQPLYTYSSGDTSTTADYIMGNVTLASLLTSCTTFDDHPLNTSDHLPVTAKLNIHVSANAKKK